MPTSNNEQANTINKHHIILPAAGWQKEKVVITRSLLTPTTNQTDATPVRQAQPFYLMRLFLIWTLVIFACLSNAAQAQTNNAQFVSQTVPATMIAGQSYPIPVTMTNNGSTTWNSAGSYGGYKLGIPHTANANWSINRVVLGTTTVAPGQSQTFTLNVTAPKTIGTYNFQWQMVQENVAWFGALTTNVAVNVVNSQTITFNPLSAQTMGVSPFALSATASSGLAVAFTSATPTTCTVSGTSVTLIAAGTCTINANQAGNTSYAAAPTVPQSFTINATTPTNNAQFVSQTVPATMIAGQSYQIPVTMTNNGSTTWNSAGSYGGYKLGIPNTANANWGINRVVLGTTTVAPGQSQTFTLNVTAPKTIGTYNFQWQMVQENVAWFGALATNVSVNVVNSQTISFTAPANQIYYSAPVTLNGSASSGLAISYAVAASSAGICSVSGNTVTLGNAGTCTITASQSGNAGYAAAPAVTVAFSVTPHSQALTIPNPNTKTLGTAPFTVSATSSVGMTPVILSSLTTGICTVSGNTVTLVAPGTCTLAANQAGNIDYSAAPQATQSFTVAPASPLTVTLISPSSGTLTAPTKLTLTATVIDTIGPVTQIAYFNGTTLMATITKSPYIITLPDVEPGTYNITAQVTDGSGLTVTSSVVIVAVVPAGGSGGGPIGEQVYYVDSDQLNTPRLITNAQGNVVWQWQQTEPFGNTIPNQDPNGTGNQFVFNLRNAGQYSDIETGLFYNYFRDYDPATGRYVESDPIGFGGGQVSTYSYVGGEPLSYIDSFGLAAGGASIGGQIGGWGAGVVGAETGPLDIPIVAAGRAIGSAIGSAVEDTFFPTPSVTVPPSYNFTPFNLTKIPPVTMAVPPNMTPNGAGRRGALRQAKRDNKVPCSKPPESQGPNKDKRGKKQPGRTYYYKDVNGNDVTIRDDAGGHDYPDDPSQDRGSHFNGSDGTHYDY